MYEYQLRLFKKREQEIIIKLKKENEQKKSENELRKKRDLS